MFNLLLCSYRYSAESWPPILHTNFKYNFDFSHDTIPSSTSPPGLSVTCLLRVKPDILHITGAASSITRSAGKNSAISQFAAGFLTRFLGTRKRLIY